MKSNSPQPATRTHHRAQHPDQLAQSMLEAHENSLEHPPALNEKHVHFHEESNNSFEPTHETYTPRITDHSKLKYRAVEARKSLGNTIAPPSSLARPNYDDSLRRVSVVVYQHIVRCEQRRRHASQMNANIALSSDFAKSNDLSSCSVVQNLDNSLAMGKAMLSGESTTDLFQEENFVSAQYKYTFVRVPRVSCFTIYQMNKVQFLYNVPTIDEIYRFCKHLFNRAQLTAECSIVCLIYIERLMERANVRLLASNWKPIILCGLLLASKVWQDLSSWNVEFSYIYPQYSLYSINRLERFFLQHIEWDLYISGSNYAKYYFALRSLTEKKDFRKRYNYSMKVDPPNTKRLEERSQAVKNELYSRSL